MEIPAAELSQIASMEEFPTSFLLVFFFLFQLEVELGALGMLDSYRTTELKPPALYPHVLVLLMTYLTALI